VVLPVLKHLVKTFPGVANDIKKPGVTELAYDRMPLKAVAATIDGWKTVRADLGKVDCPVPHFHSREDHVVDPSSSGFLKTGRPESEGGHPGGQLSRRNAGQRRAARFRGQPGFRAHQQQGRVRMRRPVSAKPCCADGMLEIASPVTDETSK
jgi:hypothetical protein